MYQENVVLCGASAYEQKYYFNKDFDSLPDHVKKELQIMCVLFTEEIGGIFTLELMIMEICSLKLRLRKLMDFMMIIGRCTENQKAACRERGASGISGNVIIVCSSIGEDVDKEKTEE